MDYTEEKYQTFVAVDPINDWQMPEYTPEYEGLTMELDVIMMMPYLGSLDYVISLN